MRIIDVHSHWGTRRGYPLQTEQGARAAASDLELGDALPHRGRDGGLLPRQRREGHPRSRLRQVPPARGDARAARLRLRDRSGPSRRHPRALGPHRSAARRPRRREGAAALHRQEDRLPRLRRVGIAVAARERARLQALLRPVHRGRHSRADLRRHHRAGRRPARRRRRHPRLLPSAPSRSASPRAIPSSRSSPPGRAGRGRPR